MKKSIISCLRSTFVLADEDKKEFRRCIGKAREYRLNGDRKNAMFYQDLAATYRNLALGMNRSAAHLLNLL